MDETNDRISQEFDKRDRAKLAENCEDNDPKPNWMKKMKRFAEKIWKKAKGIAEASWPGYESGRTNPTSDGPEASAQPPRREKSMMERFADEILDTAKGIAQRSWPGYESVRTNPTSNGPEASAQPARREKSIIAIGDTMVIFDDDEQSPGLAVDGDKVFSHDEVFETIHTKNTAEKPDGSYRHTYKRQNQTKFDDGETPNVEGIELDSAKGRVDRSKDDTTYRHSDHSNIGIN